jgi:hypothetical protein
VTYERILLVGDPGSGKTASLLTCKGRRYADIFDQAACSTLTADPTIEHSTWFPDVSKISVDVNGASYTSADAIAYNRWSKDIALKIKKKFFDGVDIYMLDSLTNLFVSCLEATQFEQNSAMDKRRTYGDAGDTVIRVISLLYSLPCHVILTIHNRDRKRNGVDMPTTTEFALPVHTRDFLPRVASNVWRSYTVNDREGTKYMLQTKSDRTFKGLKTSFTYKDLPANWDVTIKDWSKLNSYGLGTILK